MMLKPLLAAALTATAPAALTQTPPAESPATGQWTLNQSAEGCMVYASSGQGTVLSISAMPGEQALLFVIQNRELQALSDGQSYGIEVEFDDMGEWQIPAVAKAEIDNDGPGLIFAVQPGREDGANFLKEFSRASGMHIGKDDAELDRVSLDGGNQAMSALAGCLSQKWAEAGGGSTHSGQGGPFEEAEEVEADADEEAVPL